MTQHRIACCAAVGLGLLTAVLVRPVWAQPPLEALPSILHLQLDQHPAWRAYKDAAALGKAEAAGQASDASILNAMTTPQRLDALRARLKDQEVQFERQAEATDAFYAVLSPEQRQVFDEVTRLPQTRPPSQIRPRASQPYAQTLRMLPSGAGLTPPTP